MVLAGVAWGVYSLLGRTVESPILATATSFTRSIPFFLVVSVVMIGDMKISSRGALLASLSGAITSGLGYVVWYSALRGLTATRAATVQLSVPVIAAAGGVLLLSEELSTRLVVSGVAILGGIGLALLGRKRS